MGSSSVETYTKGLFYLAATIMASKITVQGARFPQQVDTPTGR